LIAYSLVRSFLRHRLYSLNVRLSNSENELSRIKQQINPHFLFNTLNYIYGTALQENATNTSRAIELLSGMMRQSLEGLQEDYVSLSREIGFIKNYIELVKARFVSNDKVVFKIEIETSEKPYRIAPMLLMPFIENAFKFGIEHDDSPFIHLRLYVEDDVLKLRIENAVAKLSDAAGTNSGLTLTRQRLKLIYPDKHLLVINHSLTSFIVSLDIQIQ
jgi:LytS/YehU family sensor histidine kinase